VIASEYEGRELRRNPVLLVLVFGVVGVGVGGVVGVVGVGVGGVVGVQHISFVLYHQLGIQKQPNHTDQVFLISFFLLVLFLLLFFLFLLSSFSSSSPCSVPPRGLSITTLQTFQKKNQKDFTEFHPVKN